MITFYNDFTLYAWISALTTKDKALQAMRHFLAYVENQYHATVQMWMLNAGGEYRSNVFDEVLKNRGIRIFQSIPYTPQQNDQVERLMQTLSNKAESMCFDVCLPES